jgi:ABC-type Mn2+/Zn2+ transport system permease subunit
LLRLKGDAEMTAETLFFYLLEPFKYGFMQRGLIAALVMGVIGGVIGCYVVLRGMAFLGDALAHAILPGIAIAYIRGVGLFWGAIVAGVLTAFGISFLSRQEKFKEDTSIGVIFAGMFGLGIALISTIRSYAGDLTHILFGNVLGVSDNDLILSGSLGFVVLLLVAGFYKEFLVISFDPVHAAALRIPIKRLDMLLLVMMAVTVVVSLQTVGAALVVAMLVTPAATASMLTKRLPPMMALSAAIGAASGLVGLYASYWLDVASGAVIVLAATLFFLLALVFAPGRGLLWERLREAQPSE